MEYAPLVLYPLSVEKNNDTKENMYGREKHVLDGNFLATKR